MADDNSAESVPDEWFDLETSAFLARLDDAAEMGFDPLSLLAEYKDRRKELLKDAARDEDSSCEEPPDPYPLVAPRRSIEALDWPPCDWETALCPAEKTVEAYRQWLNLMLRHSIYSPLRFSHSWKEFRGESVADAGTPYANDAFRLVDFLQEQGFDLRLHKSQKSFSGQEAIDELRKVRDAINPASKATAPWQESEDGKVRNGQDTGQGSHPTETAHLDSKRQDDTKDDTPKKSEKRRKRRMNAEASDCCRRFREARKADPTVTMQGVVTEYVAEQGGSVQGIMRRLNDNPGQWKTG